MRQVAEFQVFKLVATKMYPDTEQKLCLTFEGRRQTYMMMLTHDQAKTLQAKLKVMFGDNPYDPAAWRTM